MSDDVNESTPCGDGKAPGDCNETLLELQLFLDGELPDAERAHVLAHIEACLDCYHTFDFQAELKQIIATKCRTDEMPDDLMARIQQCFVEQSEPENTPKP